MASLSRVAAVSRVRRGWLARGLFSQVLPHFPRGRQKNESFVSYYRDLKGEDLGLVTFDMQAPQHASTN